VKLQVLCDDKVARLLAATLDPGEVEAIALALELPPDITLLDERDARSAAERADLRVTSPAFLACCFEPKEMAGCRTRY
jgi:predicted nucleic acid-binding protein